MTAIVPRELNRDDLLDVFPRLVLLKETLRTMGSHPTAIEIDDDMLIGLSDLAEDIHKELNRLVDADVEYDKARSAEGGAR